VHAVPGRTPDEGLRLGRAAAVYEQRYADYFRVYCDGALAESEKEKFAAALMEELKPL